MTNAKSSAKTKPTKWVDAEFGGQHGTTASGSSIDDEKEPDFHPQNASELAEKVNEEASDDSPIVGKAKKALEEVDRQIGGEYEKREDRSAPRKVARESASTPEGRDRSSGPATHRPTDPEIVRASAGAEQDHSTS